MHFFVIKSKTIKYLAIMFCCMFLLSVPFLGFGDGALASVFFAYNKTRKIPIYCVDRDDKKISISFDASWGSDKTQDILKVLSTTNTKANFFLVGMWVDKNEELVKQMDAQGIEIGTHSNLHPDMAKLSTTQQKLELSTSVEKLEKLLNKKVTLFRAPFGSYNNALIETCEGLNLKTIQWDVDTLDWKGLSASEICSRVLKQTKSGSIILCHNNADHIVEALPVIIQNLKSRGYEFVTISELLLQGNTKVDNTGKQIKM
ncbi:MAG: polysaccharide deacetylase family protein [Clostridia bacterium]|nr:polysaccharide deacetylase family protein [Clostridia bacterium]